MWKLAMVSRKLVMLDVFRRDILVTKATFKNFSRFPQETHEMAVGFFAEDELVKCQVSVLERRPKTLPT